MSSWREKLAARQKLEAEGKSPPVPNTSSVLTPNQGPKIFMVRHLERIDTSDLPMSSAYKEWIIQRNDYNYLINPYLDTEISIGKLVDNLEEKKIDHIVCSPYVRCIQTAILITNSRDLDIVDKTIHIDYKLGELVDESYLFRVPLNVESVYSHSKRYIGEKFNTIRHTLDDADNLPLVFDDYETREQYNKRILDELKNIREKYSGNILVVTHADAYKQFNSEKKAMDFGRVYDINLGSVGGYREKYIKYKTKYLELKAKIKKIDF
jgi:broad specificity phosphatase PhoE